jgi:hypothetical protein
VPEWKVKKSAGLQTAIGAACLLLAGGAVFVLLTAAHPSRQPLAVAVAVLGLAGLTLALGRRGVAIDVDRQHLSRWWGPLAPLIRKRVALGPYNRVNLFEKAHSDGNTEWTAYEVFLDSSAGKTPPFVIDHLRNYRKARKMAEAVARHCQLPMTELIRGRKFTRDHLHLDESVRDRLKRQGRDLQRLPPPPKPRAIVSPQDHQCFFDIPHGSDLVLTPRELLAIVAAGIVALAAYVLLVGLIHAPLWIIAPILAVLAAAIAAAAIAARRRQHRRIIVSPRGIRVEALDVFGPIAAEVAAADLEELELHARRGRNEILAISDEKTLRLAFGLAQDELNYLHAEFLYWLTRDE